MRTALLLLALAAPGLTSARADEAAAPPELYTRWRAGIFRPATTVPRGLFAYRSGVGLSLGATAGRPLGEHAAVEGSLGYSTARLEVRRPDADPPVTTLQDLSVAGRLVGRQAWHRLEVAASVGAALHHPSVVAAPGQGPDVALGGEVGLRIAWQAWTEAQVGLEAEQVVVRPHIAGQVLRLDGLHLALTLAHRW